jgi:hypothetical protein
MMIPCTDMALTWGFVEPMKGFERAYAAWEADLERPDASPSERERGRSVRPAKVPQAVGSPVRTQSAAVSPTPINPRHYSAVYSVVLVRNTTV